MMSGPAAGQAWQVGPGDAGVRVDIGSSPTCSWRIEAPGIAPHQVSLYWDGELLWASDTHDYGGSTIDGEPIGMSWRPLKGTCRIDFGYDVSMLVEASAPETGETTMPVFEGDLPPEGSFRMRFAEVPGLDSLRDAPAQILDEVRTDEQEFPTSPTKMYQPPGAPLSGVPTRMVVATELPSLDAALGGAVRGAPARGAPARKQAMQDVAQMKTRLAVPVSKPVAPRAPAVPAKPKAPAATIFGGAAAQPDAAAEDPAATRMLSTPERSGAAPPPRAGASARVEPQRPAKELPPTPPTVILSNLPAVAPVPPTGPTPIAAPPHDAPAPLPPPPQQPAVVARSTPPAAPAQAGELAGPPPREATEVLRRPGNKQKQALPMRTWALLAATVIAVVFVFFLGDDDETQPASAGSVAPPAQAAQQQQPPASAVVPTSDVGGSQAGSGTGSAGAMGASLANAREEAGSGSQPPREAWDDAEESGPPAQRTTAPAGSTSEREAADLLMAGRHREALVKYEALAAASPDRPVFRAIVRVLQKRLRERCRDGRDPEGNPC